MSTIYRRLPESEIRKLRAAKGIIDRKACNQASKLGKGTSSLDMRRLELLLFSDECAVQKDSDDWIMWVFRHQNNDPKNVRYGDAL